MSFTPGWYFVRKAAGESKLCLYFKSTTHYTARCLLDNNGHQFLLWADPAGPTGPGRPGQWLPNYERLGLAPAGDWWDNPRTQAPVPARDPGSHSRNARTPTAREQSGRAAAVDTGAASGLACEKEIHVGLFFDGTNNNMKRDRPSSGHSNIVSLFDAHKDDKQEYFAYYIPGVGTPFPEIGENGEDPDGKTFGKGGEARIHYGMLQVYNAACRAATGSDLLTPQEMKDLVTGVFTGLGTWWRWGDSKLVSKFKEIDSRLKQAVEGKRPRVCTVNVSVFGFSRGAAEARAFGQWIQLVTRSAVGNAIFKFQFMGIFDTVASVLLADSSPVGGSGFMDWADGTMGIQGVNRIVHYVASHEIRRSFPLSTARAGDGWPGGAKEFAYPGAHSDVGGGYSPGDQGKSKAGRSALLSQIPLNDMLFESLNAGVKFRAKTEMPGQVRADFAVDADLDKSFGAFAQWTVEVDEKQDIVGAGANPEDRLKYHMQRYWRWRASVSSDERFKALESYRNSGAQDKVDLWEAELDWRRDVHVARESMKPVPLYSYSRAGAVKQGERVPASALEREVIRQVDLAHTVTPAVSAFFDRYVHDSHAGFWLLGPITQVDRKVYIDEIKAKLSKHKYYLDLAEQTQNPGRKRNHLNSARYYELNEFEKRVLAADAANPGSMPVLTDADAEAMREREGTLTSATLWAMGTATRREASGHARYRAIFDKS
jgi:Uncharacterized alpha/beta hydrolase domain (DUF2235)